MPSAESSDCRLSGAKVLVAKDNELNVEILRGLSHMNGMVCDIVSNGQELSGVSKKSGSGQYDLTLADIQMFVMNGYDAVRATWAGRRPHAKIIPIVTMTVNAPAEGVKESADAGMDAHVPKPIDMKHLGTVIAELIKKKQG